MLRHVPFRASLAAAIVAVFGAVAGETFTGCAMAPASGSSCILHAQILPQAGVADHAAAAPGNQVQFAIPALDPLPGCVIATYVIKPTWVSSDPLKAPISNASDKTNGVATCLAATSATISTVENGPTITAALTCN